MEGTVCMGSLLKPRTVNTSGNHQDVTVSQQPSIQFDVSRGDVATLVHINGLQNCINNVHGRLQTGSLHHGIQLLHQQSTCICLEVSQK